MGNTVTGKGNILESKKHGKQITKMLIDKYLTEYIFEEWLMKRNNEIMKKVGEKLGSIVTEIYHLEIQPKLIIQNILDKTHKKLGYKDYMNWVTKNLPKRLEEIIKNE